MQLQLKCHTVTSPRELVQASRKRVKTAGVDALVRILCSCHGAEIDHGGSRSALASILDKVSTGVLSLPFTCLMSELN